MKTGTFGLGLLVLSVVGLAAGACSEGGELTTSAGSPQEIRDLTPCEGEIDEPAPIDSVYFNDRLTWWAVSGVEVRDVRDVGESPEVSAAAELFRSVPPVVVEVEEAKAVAGEGSASPTEFVTSRTRGDPLRAAAEAGMTLYLVGEDPGDARGVAVAEGGEVVFLGNCYDRIYGDVFAEMFASDAVAAAGVGTEAELLTALIAGEVDVEATLPVAAPRSWTDVSPRERQIHVGDTPAEVMAALEPLTIRFEVPGDWVAGGPTVCPWTASGWMDCIAVTAANEVAPGVVELDVFQEASSAIELWLFDEVPAVLPGDGVQVGLVPVDALGGPMVTVSASEPLDEVLDGDHGDAVLTVEP